MRNFCQSFLVICLCAAFAFAQIRLTPHKITLDGGGKTFNLNLPAGYEITPVAENLKRIRFFARAPDGRIFVTGLHDLTDNQKGAIYILQDFDAETGKVGKVVPYLTNLHNPNSVQFYTDDKGQDWLYLAVTDKLVRYKFTKGETAPTDKRPETLAKFPAYGLSYKYGGWHLTRTIAIGDNGKIYVSVGSSCNACKEKEPERATVLEMDADGKNQKIFVRGLRNAVGLKWINQQLFATNEGVDHLGDDRPDDTFYQLKQGAKYGWATCFQADGRIFADPKNGGTKAVCKNISPSYAFFPAHSSPLGFDFFDETFADANLKNAFLIALHGSTDEDIAHGYKITLVRKNEKPQDFINGFLYKGAIVGRPCDIFRVDDNSFLFSDDRAGVIYLVKRKQIASQTDSRTK